MIVGCLWDECVSVHVSVSLRYTLSKQESSDHIPQPGQTPRVPRH